jgi:hypothetical protein
MDQEGETMRPLVFKQDASGRYRMIRLFLCIGAGLLLTSPGPSFATTWRSIKKVAADDKVTITAGSQSYEYYLLSADKPVSLTIKGPRRLKIVSRYLFAPNEVGQTNYRVAVFVDGQERLRKSLVAKPREGLSLAERSGGVAHLRRCYIELGKGQHTVDVRAETSGAGRVAARFFQESRRRKVTYVLYAPETFGAVRHLQFASGSQSTYYQFDNSTPLSFSVIGPTTLQIQTRLDFDHTMNGTQSYSLQIVRDGEPWKVYHYQVKKLTTATYVKRPDILPGTRKTIRLPVPKGRHRYEIRCTRPANCGIAARIRIPEDDLTLRPQ